MGSGRCPLRGVVGGHTEVVVDFGAGTQSAEVMVPVGGLYVPLDTVRWVFSQKRRAWVENIVLKIEEVEVDKVWGLLVQVVKDRLRVDLGMQQSNRVLLWMSPPCRTFSRVDATNRNRKNKRGEGCGYRDHKKHSRPPLKTVKGRLAARHDRLVKLWVAVGLEWQRQGMQWVLENPVGSLERRPYMVELLKDSGVVMRLVHYCAYGRLDMKPTRVWTSLREWVPRGTTGTGMCLGRGRCTAMVGEGHKESVTGGRKKKRCRGQGAKAAKSAVPVMLLEELAEVMWDR